MPTLFSLAGYRFSKFTSVGLASTGSHYAVLLLAVEHYHVAPVSASLAGAGIGALVSYLLNALFTFQVAIAGWRQPLRFLIMVAAGTLLNTALMALLVMTLQRHYLGSQIVTTGIVFLWNYWVSARWVFR